MSSEQFSRENKTPLDSQSIAIIFFNLNKTRFLKQRNSEPTKQKVKNLSPNYRYLTLNKTC